MNGKCVRLSLDFVIAEKLAMRAIDSRRNLESDAVGISQSGSLEELMKKERLP